MKPKQVCILAAGQGLRMGDFLSPVNKALLPYKGKALISHIFSKFPTNTHFVIALGHLKQQIKDYIDLAHPELNIDFVDIRPYKGLGSGPGHSLLSCQKLLSDNFLVVCADTLWSTPDNDYSINENWLALAPFDLSEYSKYCLAEIQNDKIIEILDKPKQIETNKTYLAFTGIFFIKDSHTFFENLKNKTTICNEHQLSNGFSPLIAEEKMGFKIMTGWMDFGTQKQYDHHCKQDPQFIFQKKGEFIYFMNNTVIKFFVDTTAIEHRIERQKQLIPCTPSILKHRNNFYSYKMIPGESLYKFLTPPLFENLLVFASTHLWKSFPNKPKNNLGKEFYLDKTQSRIEQYLAQQPKSKYATLRAEDLPINWPHILDFDPVLFHGDFQLDNIIYNSANNTFAFIDWRQDFAGNLFCGDIYYDFAKLLASIRVNFYKLKTTNAPPSPLVAVDNHIVYETLLKQFAENRNLSFQKIEEICALVFLNMAALHRQPLSGGFWKKGLDLLDVKF